MQDFVCKMLSNEAAWQQKAEEALKHAADDSDSGKDIFQFDSVSLAG